MAANSNVLDDARKLLEERLSELKDEVRRVERAITHLREGIAERRGPGRPRKSAGRAGTRGAAGAAGATPAQTRR